MPPSRQAQHLRRQSVATLTAAAAGLPLTIGDGGRAGFTVQFVDALPAQPPLFQARYEVVAAFIRGFRLGRVRKFA